MEDVAKTYEQLAKQNAVAVIPGTPVPGHGVVADGIGKTNIYGIGTVGMQADAVAPVVMGVLTIGTETDTIDPKSMTTGITAGDNVKPDGVDSKARPIGENTDGVREGDAGINKQAEKEESPALDNFGDLPQRVQVYVVAEEVAEKIEIKRIENNRYWYDPHERVCKRIINKKTESGGNISKIIRANVPKSHAMYVSDSMASGVYSWWMDNDEFSKLVPVEKFNPLHLVLLNNGYYDLAEGCFVNYDANSLGFFFSVKVDADYVNMPLAPLSNEFFENVCLEAKDLVLAANGILLSNVRGLKKAFFFLGPRNSGKTTMGNFAKKIIKPHDFLVRNLTLAHLGDRFSPYSLMDAHFSWAGDIGAKEFNRKAFDNFKTLTGNDPFEAEGKFKDLKNCEPKCALAFNCNHFPRFPMAWDYDTDDDIEEGAGRNRIVLLHTRQTYTDEMRIAYKKKNGMTVDQVLAADKDAIVSEMIRQAGRVYRGELNFPVPGISEVYSEGKTLKERFFFLAETQCFATGNPADVIPLQELISTYKCLHPDEILPYKDPIAEERGFGAMLNYVCKLDLRYEQAKKKVPGYQNPVSCLVGCRFQDSKKTCKP